MTRLPTSVPLYFIYTYITSYIFLRLDIFTLRLCVHNNTLDCTDNTHALDHTGESKTMVRITERSGLTIHKVSQDRWVTYKHLFFNLSSTYLYFDSQFNRFLKSTAGSKVFRPITTAKYALHLLAQVMFLGCIFSQTHVMYQDTLDLVLNCWMKLLKCGFLKYRCIGRCVIIF